MPPLQPAQQGRLTNLDALRGICALLVVIFHAVPGFVYLGGGLWPGRPTFYFDLGRIGVGAFFLISGYVIPFSAKPGPRAVPRFWIVRLFRLWPAYWLSIVLALAFDATDIYPVTHRMILVNLTMLQQFVNVPNILGVFWTLQIELLFYVAVTGLLITGKLHDRRTIAFCYAACCIGAFLLAVLRWHTGHKLPLALLIALAMMFLATHIRMRRLEGKPGDTAMIISFLVMLVPTCLLGYTGRVDPQDDSMRWIVAYTLALALFLAFERARSAPRPLVLLGAISYSLYLLGSIAIFICHYRMPTHPWIAMAYALPLAILASSASFVLIERPTHELGRKLSRRIAGNPSVTRVTSSL